MSMLENRAAGQTYLESRIRDRAKPASILIDELSWHQPHNQDVSVLTITSRGQKVTYEINNPELEAQNQTHLDDLAKVIVSNLNQAISA